MAPQSDDSSRASVGNIADPPGAVSRFGDLAEPIEDPVLADMYRRIRESRGRLLNIHRAVGQAPKMLRAQAAYARALREDSSLPRSLQELLILRIAQVNDSAYEQSVHRPIALRCGVAAANIDALPPTPPRSSTRGSAPRCASSTRRHAAARSRTASSWRSGRHSRRRRSSS
jgi:alkylhydroperoxidase family enzyme